MFDIIHNGPGDDKKWNFWRKTQADQAECAVDWSEYIEIDD